MSSPFYALCVLMAQDKGQNEYYWGAGREFILPEANYWKGGYSFDEGGNSCPMVHSIISRNFRVPKHPMNLDFQFGVSQMHLANQKPNRNKNCIQAQWVIWLFPRKTNIVDNQQLESAQCDILFLLMPTNENYLICHMHHIMCLVWAHDKDK